MTNSDTSRFYIYGRRAIAEALRSERPIEKIFVEFGVREDGIHDILSMARRQRIPVVTADKQKFSRYVMDANAGTHAQGVIALTAGYEQVSDEELFTTALAQSPTPLLVALDGINDPHNLGAIARSIVCVGGQGLLLPTHNSAPITPAAFKTSAGALEYLPVAKTNSLQRSIERAKETGFWVIGTDMSGTHTYTSALYDRPVLLIIGGEGEGMRSSIRNACDAIITIPMSGKINSLNASVAAGVILFEISRQRGEKVSQA